MANYETRIEEVTYRIGDIYPMDDRRVYLRFVNTTPPSNDGWITLADGRKYAQGWELTTLSKRDHNYFMSHLDQFFALQNNMFALKDVHGKVNKWMEQGPPENANVLTVFKNKAFALRWYRMRAHEA